LRNGALVSALGRVQLEGARKPDATLPIISTFDPGLPTWLEGALLEMVAEAAGAAVLLAVADYRVKGTDAACVRV
jgi:hypothetical protein